jgi:uncharacterized membrane-anchored protein YhcB (DUF1043 family)
MSATVGSRFFARQASRGELEQLRQESQRAQQNQERHFRRRAELADLARKYRKLNAELHENDENSRRLSEFCMQESLLLQEEMRQLDSSCGDNNYGRNSTSLSMYFSELVLPCSHLKCMVAIAIHYK